MCRAEVTASRIKLNGGKEALVLTVRVEGTPDSLALVEYQLRRSIPPRPDSGVEHTINPQERTHSTTFEIDRADRPLDDRGTSTPSGYAPFSLEQLHRVAAERDSYREHLKSAISERDSAKKSLKAANEDGEIAREELVRVKCDRGDYRLRLEIANKSIERARIDKRIDKLLKKQEDTPLRGKFASEKTQWHEGDLREALSKRTVRAFDNELAKCIGSLLENGRKVVGVTVVASGGAPWRIEHVEREGSQ